MTTFLNIYTSESMILPNNYGLARVQRCNHPLSITFELDKDSIDFLKEQLPPIKGKIYLPTLKKIAENIILFNREVHYKNGESRIVLMNLPNYRYLPTSFLQSQESGELEE
ncbi:hypothetical protein BFC22_05245 [Carnobacterium divergens]|uniref:hypothetical protein n=1 Tax=Carnobacterium divergens TaxID=2748 RepID=UPI000E70AFA5|nr:hypothetical protein [Carnobacterium divergens]ANZ99531.1 hypothetical protein BFC22_05245 [Carnobacterium divergens]